VTESIVFQGQPASAEVVAGFLRASGHRFVDVIPPTPYRAGPLGDAMVRVSGNPKEAFRLLLAAQRLGSSIDSLPYPPWIRGVGTLLLAGIVLLGA
jgi:hypothetical protein